MRERRVGIEELEANLNGCLDEVQNGTTLLLTDGGRRVARVIPESRAGETDEGSAIAWSGRPLKKRTPKARLRGGASMTDIIRENRR